MTKDWTTSSTLLPAVVRPALSKAAYPLATYLHPISHSYHIPL